MTTTRCAVRSAALLALLALGAALGGTPAAFAQAPSQYLEAIEKPGATGGVETEVDAADAQAEEPAAAQRTLSRGAQGQVEEIVVSARRREELLEETPVSVTAITAATLRESGVTQLDQIQQLVPNLQIVTGNNGQDVQIRIRGVGTSTPDLAFDPGVGIFVDGVFIPRALGSLLNVLDVQQVEVLRGPQGTLFGKNTVGGAINITTVKPTEDLEAFTLIRPGNYNSVDTQTMLNIPVRLGALNDRVFTRFSFASQNAEGYTRNLFLDENWSNTNSLAFLGSIRVLPIDDVTIDIGGSWTRDHDNGMGPRCLFVQDTAIQGLFPGLVDACRRSKPFKFSADTPQLSDVQSYGTWGTVSWDVGDHGYFDDLTVKSITSWRQQRARLRTDNDGTQFPVIEQSSVGGSPFDGGPGFQQQVSEELQLTGTAFDGKLNFVTGLFGFWEDGSVNSTLSVAPELPLFVTTNNSSIDNSSYAAFAQATYDLADWISLTGGIRYTQDEKELSQINTDPLNPALPPSLDASDSATFDAWTPMGTLQLTAPEEWFSDAPVEHLMGYFTYARGFKGGGFNGVINPFAGSLEPFQPEFLDSYEIGFKTITFDDRLTFNASFFLGDYKDIQVTSLLDVTEPGGPINILQITQNAASATTKGIELEMQARPYEGWTVLAGAGILDARYDSFEDAISDLTGEPIDRSGQRLKLAPKFQSNASVQYSFPLELPGPRWLQGWVTPRLEWYYQSFVSFEGPEVTQTNQNGYNLLQTRLAYSFNDDQTEVALWGRNLTNETYKSAAISGPTPVFGIATAYYAAPVTFGAEISHRF